MRCSRCVLPDTTPHIEFDDQGVCSYCHTYKPYPYQGEEALRSLLEEQRTRAKGKYDCLVPVSGGRDSSYTLLKVAKDLNMRVLAVNYENPFTDPLARQNIERATQTLGVDLIKFRHPRRLHERTFSHNLATWYRRPSAAMIPMVCIACKTIIANILQIARAEQVPCIITGGNPYEYTSFKKELLQVSRDDRPESFFIKSFAGLMQQGMKNVSYFSPTCLPTLAKGFLFGNPYALGSRVYGRDIARIDLFHYVRWEEDEVISRIRGELGWDSPARFPSNWRFDCKVGHLKDLMYMQTLQMTERDDFYAKAVRDGMMTREAALERLEHEEGIYWLEIEDVLHTAGVPEDSDLSRQLMQQRGVSS